MYAPYLTVDGLTTQWDHVPFPGAVPRSFVPPILLGAVTYPFSALAVYTGWIDTKIRVQILRESTTRTSPYMLTVSTLSPRYLLLGFTTPPLPLNSIPIRSSSQMVVLALHPVELSYPILRRKDDTELYGSSHW